MFLIQNLFILQIFFSLRKKDSHISFLHVYHHLLTFVGAWVTTRYMHGRYELLKSVKIYPVFPFGAFIWTWNMNCTWIILGSKFLDWNKGGQMRNFYLRKYKNPYKYFASNNWYLSQNWKLTFIANTRILPPTNGWNDGRCYIAKGMYTLARRCTAHGPIVRHIF